jgi:hypothetical protein
MSPNPEALQAEIKAEFPAFQLKPKSSSLLMKAIGLVFGKRFMDSFVTTILNTVYTPTIWDDLVTEEQCAILRHERVHMRQARKLSFPVFAFLYLLAPVPVCFAWFRTKFEEEAYEETLRASKDYGMDYLSPERKASMIHYFTSGDYGLMWVIGSQVEAWFDRTVAKLNA